MTAPTSWKPEPETVLNERLRGKLFATVSETSVVLGVDIQGRTIRKAIAAGEIPAVRAGATWRVPVTWIRQQVQLGSEGTAGAA